MAPVSMSLNQKVGTLLMAPLASDRLEELMERFACGSLITWGGAFGTTAPDSIDEFVALANRAQALALQHRGVPVWLHGQPPNPFVGRRHGWEARAAEARVDPARVERAATLLGIRWRALGVHNMLGPTLNVPLFETCILKDSVIARDAETVRVYGTAFNRGVLAARCGTMAQHFPAHGATPTDSHDGFPVVELSREELWRDHLLPYQQCFDEGCTTICTAHLACPALDPTPDHMATASRPILTDFLKGEMGFRGIAIADAVEMQGFRKNGPITEVVVDAVNAGCDSLCMVEIGNVEPVFTALMAAAEAGRIPQERLDDAVARNHRFTQWLGLDESPMVDADEAARRLAETERDADWELVV